MKTPRDITERKFASDFNVLKESKENILHIISAGPSVKDFDWQIIRGKDIMTINDSIFYLPLKVTYHVYNEPINKEAERYLKMTRKYPFVHKFTTFDYKNWHQLKLYNDKNLTFMLAINIAIDLGYEKAFLYGYDFDCINGFIHWWDDKPEKNIKIIESKMKLINKQKNIFNQFKIDIQDKIILKEIKFKNG